MSELVLIAADFYGAANDLSLPARGKSLPHLSRIARYGTVEPVPAGWRAWVAAGLGRDDLASAGPASIASAAWGPEGGVRELDAASRQFLWLVDPVYLIVGPTSVHLAANGRIALEADMQRALRSAFSESFAHSGYSLEPLRGGGFLARGPAPAGEVQTTEPARVLGSSIADALPRGRGAGALRALGAEIEMWLHEHPLNARRAREGRPPISTLWFWGGGPPLGAAPGPAAPARPSDSPGTAIFGDDSFMEGLARLTGAHFGTVPADLNSVVKGDASRHIVALELLRTAEIDPLAALERFERDWLGPALEQLRQGNLARLTVLANDRQLSIGSRDRFRLWRRPRAALAALR